MTKITRIEVIDENGRSYVNRGDNNDVSYQLQDDGKTLKVFVNKEPKMTLKDEGKFHFVDYDDNLYHRIEYAHIPVVWWFENVNTLEHPVPMHRKVMDGELNKTLEQLYQKQIAVKESPQERGDQIHNEVEKLLSENENEWKLAALRFGEKLSSIGPCGYYDFSAGEWVEWALNAYEKTADDYFKLLEKERVKVKKLQEKEWKVDVKTDLKPWEPTAQTPEETERGLRDAMKQAKKDGVFDKSPLDIINEWAEKNKPPSLHQILMNWWMNLNLEEWSDKEVVNSLIDVIDKKFIPPHSDTNDYQWNKCLKIMRDNLR